MIIQRKINGKLEFIELTAAEIKLAYEEQKWMHLEEDAKKRFLDLFDDSPEFVEDISSSEKQRFLEDHGFSVEEAVDPKSKHYFLDCIARRYDENHECNIADNDQWYALIRHFLETNKKEECK